MMDLIEKISEKLKVAKENIDIAHAERELADAKFNDAVETHSKLEDEFFEVVKPLFSENFWMPESTTWDLMDYSETMGHGVPFEIVLSASTWADEHTKWVKFFEDLDKHLGNHHWINGWGNIGFGAFIDWYDKSSYKSYYHINFRDKDGFIEFLKKYKPTINNLNIKLINSSHGKEITEIINELGLRVE